MAKCGRINIKKRQLCIGDLDKSITIFDRDIAPDDVDFKEVFSNASPIFAAVQTLAGVTIFDKVNGDRSISHDFYVRFDPNMTAEKWIAWDDDSGLKFYDILSVINVDGESRWHRLRSNERGDTTVEVNAL